MSLFQYGNYRHPANEVNVVRLEKNNILSPRGQRMMAVHRMHIEMVIEATSVSALTTRINEIITAYESDFWNAQLYSDDAGTIPTAHYLPNNVANALSGVRVIRGPVFDRADGAEYANKRTATVTLEGTYEEAQSDLVYWREKVRFIGNGGPEFAVVNTVNGPIAQQLYPSTAQIIIQSGEALGFIAPVIPPGPSFSGVIIHNSEIEEEEDSGRCLGLQFRFFPSRWHYRMTALSPTFGGPITR